MYGISKEEEYNLDKKDIAICPHCNNSDGIYFIGETTSCHTERWKCDKCGRTFDKPKQEGYK